MKTTHTSGQMIKFLALLEEKGSTPEIFQTCLGNGILADILDPNAVFPERDEWRKLLGLGPVMPEIMILTVDYNLSHDQMIAAGNYDWKNSDLTPERFPIVGEGIVQFEARLCHPNCTIFSEAVLKQIREADSANPWQPAQTEHLLAFGAKYPEAQRKYPIVALGSVARVERGRRVPCLIGDGGERGLGLGWFGGDWFAYSRFLEVRKVSASVAVSPSA